MQEINQWSKATLENLNKLQSFYIKLVYPHCHAEQLLLEMGHNQIAEKLPKENTTFTFEWDSNFSLTIDYHDHQSHDVGEFQFDDFETISYQEFGQQHIRLNYIW